MADKNNNNLFLIGAVAIVGGYFMLNKKPSTAGSTSNAGGYLPTTGGSSTSNAGGQSSSAGWNPGNVDKVVKQAGNVLQTGKDLLAQIFPPERAGEVAPLTPIDVQINTGGPKAGPPSTSALNRFGVPHQPGGNVPRANTFPDGDGSLWKSLSDAYHLFWEDIENLFNFDVSFSRNPFGTVLQWYRNNPDALLSTIDGYNQANPAQPIKPRW